ncbi:MAG TPA: response regulator transcription factor [Cyclobacteriaceae bacterium]|nr:response regulator transcription factor [Cyclobacteriaceae bacterium]
MNKIKLILADDHPLIREGFRSLLGKNEAFEIVGEAENGIELMRLASEKFPDIILVDITMPTLSGLDSIEKLRATQPYIKFIVLTMHDEPEYVLKALKRGADGYLLKNIERPELEKAIQTVYAGGKYYSPFVANILAESISKRNVVDQAEITPREKEVLELVAAGQSTKQIANKLDISIRTVESHRINMLKKLSVNNTAELIKRAVELKILS